MMPITALNLITSKFPLRILELATKHAMEQIAISNPGIKLLSNAIMISGNHAIVAAAPTLVLELDWPRGSKSFATNAQAIIISG